MAENDANSVILLRQSQYRIMNWKNGKGKSEEIAIHPSHAIFPDDPFLWRLSSAHLSESGAFSHFPGYERQLVLIQGGPLKLHLNSSELILKQGECFQFSGDKEISYELVSKDPDAVTTAQDLNFIFKSDQIKANFVTIELSRKSRSFEIQGKVAFIYAIHGSIKMEVFPGEKKMDLAPGETLYLESRENNLLILLEPRNPSCLLALVEINSAS